MHADMYIVHASFLNQACTGQLAGAHLISNALVHEVCMHTCMCVYVPLCL